MPRSVALFLVTLAAVRGADLPDHVMRLARVKTKVVKSFESIPNYTCLAVTERGQAGFREPRPRHMDTVRMEVAHADGHDLYAWPGANRFEQRSDAMESIGSGMYSSGEFASHLRSIFGGYAVIKYAGEENRLGRRVWHWNFRLAQFGGGWMVRFGSRSTTAAETGSFWVDAATLDVIRIEVHTDGLPPHFPISEVVTTVDYARVRLGPREVLLPQSAMTIASEDFSGIRSFNYTEFSHCRQYVTDSAVTYEVDSSAGAPAAGAGLRETAIGAGLRVIIALTAEVDSARAAVGDPIEAVVAADVLEKKRVAIPKGAVLRGRLRRMESIAGAPEHFTIGLEFTDIEFDGNHATFFGTMTRVDSEVPGLKSLISSASVRKTRRGVETIGTIYDLPHVPGVGMFFIEGSWFRLVPGFTTTWVTEDIAKK